MDELKTKFVNNRESSNKEENILVSIYSNLMEDNRSVSYTHLSSNISPAPACDVKS